MSDSNHRENTTPLWTVSDVASYLRLDPETVRVMARNGKIPAIKIGRQWRFRKEQIQLWAKGKMIDKTN